MIIISILKIIICLLLLLLLTSGVGVVIYELVMSMRDCNELEDNMNNLLNKNQDSQK